MIMAQLTKHRTWARASSFLFFSLPFSNCSKFSVAHSTCLCKRTPPSSPPVQHAGKDCHLLRRPPPPCGIIGVGTAGSHGAASLGEALQARPSWHRPNADKSLNSFIKATTCGFALTMVTAGLIYWVWEGGKKPKAMEFYLNWLRNLKTLLCNPKVIKRRRGKGRRKNV
ncbi:F-box protein [Glycine soja]